MRAFVAAGLAAGAVLALPPTASTSLFVSRVGQVRAPVRSGVEVVDAEEECLAVLDSMIVLLQAGSSAASALELATKPVRGGQNHTAEGWAEMVLAAQQGGDVAQVWQDVGQRWQSAACADVAAAWRMSARHGCPLAEAMAAAASGIRAQRRQRGAVEGAVAGARATMGVLMLLPVLGVALGLVLGVDMLGSYVGVAGLVTLWPGLALLWMGHRWAERLVTRALSSPDAEAADPA